MVQVLVRAPETSLARLEGDYLLAVSSRGKEAANSSLSSS